MKKKIRTILSILLLVLAALCAVVGIRGYLKEQNAGATYAELRDEVSADSGADLTDSSSNKPDTNSLSGVPADLSSSQENAEDSKSNVSDIDFAELQKKAPDAYAWIRIPDTRIDYPICQSETDNAYYLSHTAQKEDRFEGAIFTENYNSKDFTDPVTVIYGHNMKNGSMFADLHQFSDKDFFEKHPTFTIETADGRLNCRVFAAYTADNRHLLKNYDFNSREVYASYLKSIFQIKDMSANIDDTVTVTPDDRIVVLSTCTGDHSTRFLVQAKITAS
ncbi:MAG: class B sortase [Bilifractor sp.]|nr:class B sortase [Lachnospiraceae bacterium]MDY2838207.1 class B sortase [Bilifractor sp.]